MATLIVNTALTPEAAAQAFFDKGYRQTSRRNQTLARVDVDDVRAFYRDLGYDNLAGLPLEQAEDHYRRVHAQDRVTLPKNEHKEWSGRVMAHLRDLTHQERDREWTIANDPTEGTIKDLHEAGDVERLKRVAKAQLLRATSAEARLMNLNPAKSLYEIRVYNTDMDWDDVALVESALTQLGLTIQETSILEVEITASSDGPVPSNTIFEAIEPFIGKAETWIERFDLLDKVVYNKKERGV